MRKAWVRPAAGILAALCLTQYAMLPSDLIGELPYAFRALI